MKKKVCILLSILLAFSLGGCVNEPDSSNSETPPERLEIATLNQLANYFYFFYANEGIQPNTQMNHYLYDDNFLLESEEIEYTYYDKTLDTVYTRMPSTYRLMKVGDSMYFTGNSEGTYENLETRTKGKEIQQYEWFFDGKTNTGYNAVVANRNTYLGNGEYTPLALAFESYKKHHLEDVERFEKYKKRDGSNEILTVIWYDCLLRPMDCEEIESDYLGIKPFDENAFKDVQFGEVNDEITFSFVFENDIKKTKTEGKIDRATNAFTLHFTGEFHDESLVVMRWEYEVRLSFLEEDTPIAFNYDRDFEDTILFTGIDYKE